MADDAKKLAIVVVAGVVLGGIAYLATRKAEAAPPPGAPAPKPGAPSGQVVISLSRNQARQYRTLYSLPNDVTFSVTGTVTKGNPAPTMTLVVEYMNASGAWVIYGSTAIDGAVPVGEKRSAIFQGTPDILLRITGRSSGAFTVRGKILLTSTAGKGEAVSPTQTFNISAPAPTAVAPEGSVAVSLFRQRESLRQYRKWAE